MPKKVKNIVESSVVVFFFVFFLEVEHTWRNFSNEP